jgi:hypothetical protein
MAVLGGGLFLMSEVPLYIELYPQSLGSDLASDRTLQGYLAHKEMHPPRTLLQVYA